MSASTPPILSDEIRLPLPEECHIPLPPSPIISAQDAEKDDEHCNHTEPLLPLSLLELLHSIQEDKYESRRLSVLQDEAYGLFHKCGSCDRFLTVQAQLYRYMMDSFQNDKKMAFASLYIKAMSYPAFGELRIKSPVLDGDLEIPAQVSWIDRLPADSRLAVMDFLHRLRSDPGFVSDRISKLSSEQLKKLIRLHGPLEPGRIFRGHQPQGRYDSRNVHRGMPKSNEAEISVDDLLSDPLLLMVHGVFDRNDAERSYQCDVWSSVCAKLLEDGKPGSNEFCITVMNLFVDLPDWNATPKLELLLSDLVSSGASFLEAGASNTQFAYAQPRDASTATSTFLESYIPRLLDLLCNNPAPSQALDLIRLILAKILDPDRKLVARNFLFLRWYCASFLFNAIIYPENHGMMMEHHINNSIRQKILRELALRVQNVVSEFLSTSSNIGYSPWQSKLHHILTLVERNDRLPSSITRENSGGRCFLFLRCEDVLAMAKSLIATPQPESSSTSVFERTPSSSSSTLANQLPNKPGIVESLAYSVSSEFSTMASQTWHNSRPFLTSIYDTIGSTTTHNRPNSSGTLVVESEKQSSLSFIHDLWVLNASRDFQLPGSSKNEVAVVFTREDGDQLSLQPFRVYSNAIKPVEFTTILSTDDQTMLTTAVLLLAERTAELQRNHSAAALASLKGLIDMLRDKLREANDAYDFQAEYFWSQCLDIILNTKSNSVIEFLSSLVEERNARITYKRDLAKEYDDWLHVLRGRSNTQDQQNQRLSLSSKRLRNKMWYVSDIRHSSAYEDACNVIRALRAMIEPVEHRPSGVAGWAKQRFRSSYGQERTLAQLLELMTAPKTYGGPNKLSENQVEITSGWLLHDNVENFCGGEERIHRFCYEIQKCVKRLAGEAMLDSPVLWSSPLYTNEKSEYGITGQSGTRHQQDRAGWRTDFSYPQWPNMQPLPGQPSFPSSDLNSSTTSPTRPTFDHPLQSPFQPMIPPNSVGPQGSRNWMLPPSPISPGNVKISQDGTSLRRRSFLQNLRIHLTSLLLSDLGSSLWNHGTETDRWISALDSPPRSSPVISQYTPQMDLTENPDSQGDTKSAISVVHPSFNFIEAQQVLLQRFRLASNPQMKLQYLHELFMLLRHARQSGGQERFNHLNHTLKGRSTPLGNIGIGNSVPRTRLTRLQEVAANCEDRRISSVINSRCGPIFNNHERVLHGPDVDDSELITALQDIFEDSSYRPPAFFRDLQYIAAFTPSSILDHTPQGTAFWTVGLAAMRIKSEKSKIMTDNAMQILEYHYGNGGKSEPIRIGQSSPRQGSITTSKLSQQDLLGTTLQDAARMLTVSALEGDPTAARELALFHLTHPELVSRVTLPLSRPSDIFRAKNGIASERGNRPGNQDSGILDSVTFAVVYHWMEFAANAGDVDAITFFKDQ